MARISKDHVDKWFDYSLDLDSRSLWIGSIDHRESDGESGVNSALAEQVIKGLHLLGRSDPEGNKPVTVILNTPGGDEVEGLAIYDALRVCRSHVTGIVFGKAWSMGAYIFQACDERVMARNSSIMIHDGTLEVPSDHPQIVKAWTRFYQNVNAVALDNILLDRIREKHPQFSSRKLRDMLEFDTILTPQQAIEIGLADKILE